MIGHIYVTPILDPDFETVEVYFPNDRWYDLQSY